MEKSFMGVIEANSVIRLKTVTVTLERLSDATILKYTGKSVFTGSQSDKDNPWKLVTRFCPFCNEAAPAAKHEKITVKTSCQKCGTNLNYKCLKCKIEYKHYMSIFAHIQTKCGTVTRYSCSLCEYVTTAKPHLRRHIVSLHSNQKTSVKCKKCGGQFKHSYSIKSHLRYCGKAPDLFCSFCNFKTVHRTSLKYHLQKHTSDESTSSSQTDPSITNNGKYCQLIIRLCKHCKENIEPSAFQGKRICPKCKSKLSYQCAKCGLESNIYWRMYYHVGSKCGARVSQCPRCNKIFPSSEQLRTHLRSCAMKFSCELCPFETTNRNELKSHSKQHLNCTNKLSNDVKNKFLGGIASKNDISTVDIKNVDLNIVKVEKDMRLNEYIDTSSEIQFEADSDFPVVKQEMYVKEELMLSMSESSDNETENDFLSLKRKYHDFDDQLVSNATKKLKMD